MAVYSMGRYTSRECSLDNEDEKKTNIFGDSQCLSRSSNFEAAVVFSNKFTIIGFALLRIFDADDSRGSYRDNNVPGNSYQALKLRTS